MLSQYDKENVDVIIGGYGDWFSAHVIRFVAKVYHKADDQNKRRLWSVFPEEIAAVLRSRAWTDLDLARERQRYLGH